MKTLKLFIALLGGVLLATSCDAIEDDSLTNGGTPVTTAELNAALTVTQPIPNVEGQVDGDQYVEVKNSLPIVGGAWIYEWPADNPTSSKIYGSDAGTIVMTVNADYNIFYRGISAGQVVQSDKIRFTVTNCFDEWSGFLTGAVNKADATAKKTWHLYDAKEGSNFNGAYGAWKYYDVETSAGTKWGSAHMAADSKNWKMELSFDGFGITTSNSDGVIQTGTFAFDKTVTDEGVKGQFIPTVRMEAVSGWDWNGQSNSGNTFWILNISDQYLTIFKPGVYSGNADWDTDGWYAFYEAE
jgi:hypothetical protein